MTAPGAYWSRTAEQVIAQLQSARSGLTQAAAEQRLRQFGPNQLRVQRSESRLSILLRQLASPLLLLLVFAAIVAAATGDLANAGIVLTILFASAFIG